MSNTTHFNRRLTTLRALLKNSFLIDTTEFHFRLDAVETAMLNGHANDIINHKRYSSRSRDRERERKE